MVNLRNILKEFKENTWDKLDGTVLKQYTKLTKKWEEKGHSRYSLAHAFNLSSLGIYLSPLVPVGIYPLTLGASLGMDLPRNLLESLEKKETMEGEIAESPINSLLLGYKDITNLLRLPFFISGVSLMVKGSLGLIDYFNTQNSNSLNNAIDDLSLGYSSFGLSSSIYVKDSNPKLLEKAPMWKQAYESLKEKIFSPKPVPQPVSVGINRSLESRV